VFDAMNTRFALRLGPIPQRASVPAFPGRALTLGVVDYTDSKDVYD
jgi:hypothetical protein